MPPVSLKVDSQKSSQCPASTLMSCNGATAGCRTVAKVLSETRPRDAVFSHISLYGQADIPPATEDELTSRVRAGYDGPFVIGQDLMAFTIGGNGVVRQPYASEMRHRSLISTMQ